MPYMPYSVEELEDDFDSLWVEDTHSEAASAAPAIGDYCRLHRRMETHTLINPGRMIKPVHEMPKIDGLITFLYYDDLTKATKFYTETLGLKVIVDQGWAKILKLTDTANVGLVDGKKGSLRPSTDKPVMVTILVPKVDAWYAHFKKLGVTTMSEPHDEPDMNLRQFMIKDPEGYVIEFQHFY